MLSQVLLCLGSHTLCPLTPEADGGRTIQVREKSFRAYKAKRNYWLPRSQNSQVAVTRTETLGVHSIGEKPSLANTVASRIQAAPKSGNELGDVSRPPVLRHVFERASHGPERTARVRLHVPPKKF